MAYLQGSQRYYWGEKRSILNAKVLELLTQYVSFHPQLYKQKQCSNPLWSAGCCCKHIAQINTFNQLKAPVIQKLLFPPLLYKWRDRSRKVEPHGWGHTAMKWHRRDLNPSSPTLDFRVLSVDTGMSLPWLLCNILPHAILTKHSPWDVIGISVLSIIKPFLLILLLILLIQYILFLATRDNLNLLHCTLSLSPPHSLPPT